MSRIKYVVLLSLVIGMAISLPSKAHCDWPQDGFGVCIADGAQAAPAIIEADSGASIIVWEDNRSGDNLIYAQLLDSRGKPLWAENGIEICAASDSQATPVVVSDGAGGAIIVWSDRRGGEIDIYAQRLDSTGSVQWDQDGVALCAAGEEQYDPDIASDGEGGAIVVWTDARTDTTKNDIYAQRVGPAGNVLWTPDGVSLCVDDSTQTDPVIVSDGLGGAIVAWNDYRNDSSDVFAQRVDADGNVLWTYNGVALVQQPGDQWKTTIVADDGAAIFIWEDHRGVKSNIYAQRVDASGSVQWGIDGEELGSATDGQEDPASISDGSSGAFVFWSDDRTGYKDIYGQHISSAADNWWSTELICTSSWDKRFVQVISDCLGGSIIAWLDMRDGLGDVYAQRVAETAPTPTTRMATPKWGSLGAPLCSAEGEQIDVRITSDGFGGAVATWGDFRTGVSDIYAQRVARQGHWGYPCPTITSIEDIPADQGGQAWITFEASRLDTWQDPKVIQYSIWRSLDPDEAAAMKKHGVVLSSPAQARPEMAGKAVYFSPTGGWALVGGTNAFQLPEYGYVTMTLRDSTSADPALEYYFVSAVGFGLADHWESPVMAGYSVDNLAPGMPLGLAASHIGDTGLWIHWNPNPEEDLSHYAIYRGTQDFVPDETNRIGTATDTVFIDENTGGDDHYYKVSAVDVHENEGPHATLTPDMIVGTREIDPRYSNALLQNVPNPFRSSTVIAFSMQKEGRVRLSVFDAKGRLVRVLVDEIRQPQGYVEQWDGRDSEGRKVPVGAYFYRLEVPGWSAVKKMTFAR